VNRGAGLFRSPLFTGVLAGCLVGTLLLVFRIDVTVSDIEYDWLAVGGALHGEAYAPVAQLAANEGVEVRFVLAADGSSDVAHPRTPAGLVLLTPLRLLSFEHLLPVATALSVAVMVIFVVVWARDVPGARWKRGLVVILGAVSAPVITTLAYGGQAIVVAGLTLGAWVISQRGRSITPTLLAAAAMALKLFPAILIPLWWVRGRRDLAVSTTATFAVMNALGLLLPGVSPSGALAVLVDASSDFLRVPTNGSLTGLLVEFGISPTAASAFSLTLLVAFAFALIVSKSPLPKSLALSLGITLLLLIVSWASYDVVLVPFAMILAVRSQPGSITPKVPLLLWGVVTFCFVAGLPLLTETIFAARVSFLVALFLPGLASPAMFRRRGSLEILAAETVQRPSQISIHQRD
jgi:hypothetical protein